MNDQSDDRKDEQQVNHRSGHVVHQESADPERK
jgi:hypothetical protein